MKILILRMATVIFNADQINLSREIFRLKVAAEANAKANSEFSELWNTDEAKDLRHVLKKINGDIGPENLPNYLTRKGMEYIQKAAEELFDDNFRKACYGMTAVSILYAIMTPS